jgi:hypothetical protein
VLYTSLNIKHKLEFFSKKAVAESHTGIGEPAENSDKYVLVTCEYLYLAFFSKNS